jgi:hypothetical protein
MSSKKILFSANPNKKILDKYPADLAFSLFKIRSTYSGNCIRVVRDSDFATMDIGFLGDALDTVSLLSFVGSANGYIDRWYNQSSANTATQVTHANRPKIVSSGVLETLNGKPSLKFNGTDSFLQFSNEYVTNDFSVFSYGKRNASGSIFAPLSGTGVALLHYSDNNYYFQTPAGYAASTSTDTSSSSYMLEAHSTVSTRYLYKNQSLVTTSFTSFTLADYFFRIGDYNLSNRMNGYLSEVILYKSNKITDKNAIGNDIITRNS